MNSTTVRLGQVETLKESGSRSIGVRVFHGQRAASTYSSDFSAAGIDRMLSSALVLAKITSEDPFAGIPDAAKLGSISGQLDLYHEDVYSLPGSERIDYARRAEKAALDSDPRLKNSDGGAFDAATGRKILANSTDLWANTGALIARCRLSPLRRTMRAICSVITGIRLRAVWQSSNLPKQSAKRLPGALFAASAREK